MSDITIDHGRLIVFIRVTGFLDADAITQITAQMRDAARTLGDALGKHDFLADLSETMVCPGPAIDQLCALMSDPATRHLWARRVAFFTPSVLLRLQLRRVCEVRPGIAAFADRRSASDWLAAERQAIAA